MTAPLYKLPNQTNYPKRAGTGHKGLFFDRFFNQYDLRLGIIPNPVPNEPSPRQKWIDKIGGLCGDSKALEQTADRQAKLIKNLQGISHRFKTDWHFVTGMGNSHPVENGFSWHPTLGTPYLSGASVKGLVRSWLENWGDLESDTLHRWFGSDKNQQEIQAGEFIFFDALPTSSPKLTTDIMTPHMGKWYAEGNKIENIADNPDKVPADWHAPNPIPFLVVREAVFQFCIAPRKSNNQQDLPALIEALNNALDYLGAGAKTAVGYGRMNPEMGGKAFKDKIHKEKLKQAGSIEDQAKLQITEWISNNKLEEEIGKKYSRNQKKDPEQWSAILGLLLSDYPRMIDNWKSADNNTLPRKAFRQIQKYLDKKIS